jgi:hypothetical protein
MLSELPAHKPSPPFSEASTIASAPESEEESAAKLSTGALRMGTKSGLLLRACGIPENHTGARPGVVIGLLDTGIGITVAGSSLSGKCETRGVPGGGKMSENSEASEFKRFCLEGSASNRFVPLFTRDTRDWGVMSSANAA